MNIFNDVELAIPAHNDKNFESFRIWTSVGWDLFLIQWDNRPFWSKNRYLSQGPIHINLPITIIDVSGKDVNMTLRWNPDSGESHIRSLVSWTQYWSNHEF